MVSRRLFSFTVLLALAALSAPGIAADLVLARVAGEPVTLDELKFEFERRHQGHLQMLGDEDVLRDFLEGAIRRRLFTQEARRMGLAETAWIEEKVREEREKVGIAWLYRVEVEESVTVTPEALDEALEKLRVSYQLIVVETDSLEEARAAWSRIDGGESAEDVARAVSQAPSRLRGGLLGIAWGRSDMPALEEALVGTEPGDLLEPVALERGWIVAQVEQVEQFELKDEEISRNVARNVLQLRAIAGRRAEYLDGLRTRYDVEVADELLVPERLIELAGTERSTTDSDDPVVATWTGGSLGLAEFATSIRRDTFAMLRPGQQRLQAEQLLTNRLDQDVLRLEVEARWAEAPDDARVRVATVENDLIFRELLGGVVFSEIEITEDEIAEWYAAHPGDFVEPTRILLAIAALATEEEARAFIDEVEAGAMFSDLARDRSLDATTSASDGVAGWVTEDEAVAELRGEPFSRPTGSLGGPVRLGELWVVYRVLDRVEASPIPLAQVAEQIRSSLTERKSTERMDAWELQLREVTAVRVNDGAIRKAGRQLAADQKERFREAPPAPASGHGRGHP